MPTEPSTHGAALTRALLKELTRKTWAPLPVQPLILSPREYERHQRRVEQYPMVLNPPVWPSRSQYAAEYLWMESAWHR